MAALNYNKDIFTNVRKWDNENSYLGVLVAGKLNQYNGQGYPIEHSFYGVDGMPTLHLEGYAKYVNKYDNKGNRIDEAYYGLDGKLVIRKNFGAARVKMEYNAKGQNTAMCFFDEHNRPSEKETM